MQRCRTDQPGSRLTGIPAQDEPWSKSFSASCYSSIRDLVSATALTSCLPRLTARPRAPVALGCNVSAGLLLKWGPSTDCHGRYRLEHLENDGDLGYKGLSPLNNSQRQQVRRDTGRSLVEDAKAGHVREYSSKRGEFCKDLGYWLTRFQVSPT